MPPHAAEQPGAAENRRKDIRIQILGQLYGHIVPFDVPLAVQNLSAGGFAVDSPIQFYPGTSHQFRFTLRDGRTVKVGAQTAHCLRVRTPAGETRFLAGFEFLREADDTATADAIEALLDGALAPLSFQ